MSTEDDRLANVFGAMCLALVDKMEAAFARQGGRGASATAALVQIGSEPGLSIEDLRRAIGLSHSATVRLVDQLAVAGLLERRSAVEGDRRQRTLLLTAAGRAEFEHHLAARRAVIDRAMAALSPAERAVLGRLAEKTLPALVDPGDDQDVVCRVCDQSVCTPELCPLTHSVR